ncbi:MAG: hypothetical protein KKC64_10110, partial [Spirochaetes bacterium]|nr:hypothetical protein [Spirochaetota bacterium]
SATASAGSQPETDPPPAPAVAPAAAATTAPRTAPALFTAEGQFASHILAFYGKPGSKALGILGQYDKHQLGALLLAYSDLYDKANGEMAVLPAFYLLFGLCWPEGEIGYTPRAVLEDYIEFAASQGWLVFIDHQIGRYTVAEAMKTMLPYLRYPNVHLALDPEWRTTLPMKEIGTMSAGEFNEAQAIMEAYLAEHELPGRRMLIVHQFHPRMLTDPQLVRTDFARVLPVHVADGIGNPALKRYSYAQNARYTNMPVKGFKLFFESKVAGARWDIPLMTPAEVLQLQPQPIIFMYQ